ncbi:MAG: OmpA family protein [Rhodospirillales bacterium]|nr:MAG: OmpA family protein [Rhodospirillales bacterium]
MRAIAGIVAGVVLLAGCSGHQLGSAQKVEPSGSEFSQNLYRGYIGLAENEYAEADYKDSDRFAVRATEAGRGGAMPPEDIGARKLPAENIAEMTDARAGLVAALEAGAAEQNPAGAAQAQIMFDCWMQEQEENRQPGDIARCRDGFYVAFESLSPPPALSEAVRFIIYFPTDKAVLDPQAERVIAEAQAAAAKLGEPVVKISGHTDTVGTAAYNQTLSALRADAVAKILASGDMPIRELITEAHGKTQPAVLTADETAEPRNRRVEIILEP